MLFYFKLVILLAGMAITAILPFQLFKKSLKESAWVALAIAAFFVFQKNLILGAVGPFHDVKALEYVLLVFKQYFENGIALGWNPYMNAGEPVYLFSHAFLRLPWAAFILVNKIFHFQTYHLFNLFWIFLFLNFCAGSLLLFQLLFEDFKVAFFCFLTLLFSNMFLLNLGQVIGLTSMYYLPWILFCIVLFVKRRKASALAFALLFTAISLNTSIPHIIFLALAVFTLLTLCFFFRESLVNLVWRKLKSKPLAALTMLLITLIIASPLLLSAAEMNNYACPHRGGAMLMEGIRSADSPFWLYKIVFQRQLFYLGDLHFAFYFGLLPLLLFLLAFVDAKNKYVWVFFLSFLLFLFFALGEPFFVYRLIVRYLPTFKVIRSALVYAQYACFFAICLSGFGLKELLKDNQPIGRSLAIILTAALMPLAAYWVTRDSSIFIFAAFIYVCLAAVFYFSQSPRLLSASRPKLVLYLTCLGLLLFDLLPQYYKFTFKRDTYYSTFEPFSYKKPKEFREFSYPLERSLLPREIVTPVPPDFSSFAIKEGSLTARTEFFIFFRDRYLNEMMLQLRQRPGFEKALGVGAPLIYFADKARVIDKANNKEAIDMVYKDPVEQGDTGSVVFFRQDLDPKASQIDSGKPKDMRIEYTKTDNPNMLEFIADVPANGFIVRRENFHRGWKAFIDGKRTPVYRANYAFQAIRAAPGNHKILFRFTTAFPLLMNLHLILGFFTVLAFNAFLVTRYNMKGRIG